MTDDKELTPTLENFIVLIKINLAQARAPWVTQAHQATVWHRAPLEHLMPSTRCPSDHFLSSCNYLVHPWPRSLLHATQIVGILEGDCEETPIGYPHTSPKKIYMYTTRPHLPCFMSIRGYISWPHPSPPVDSYLSSHPDGLAIICGDFNGPSTGLTERQVKHATGLTQVVKVLTRDSSILVFHQPTKVILGTCAIAQNRKEWLFFHLTWVTLFTGRK